MNIIWAIREICVGEKGIENLFDREKSYQKLIDLSDNKNDAIIFTTLLYGQAREVLIELIHDAYNYQIYIEQILAILLEYEKQNPMRRHFDIGR